MKRHNWKYVNVLILGAMLIFSLVGVTPAHAGIGLTVINTNDSGPGSLRQAVIDAASGDTINFDPSLSGGTITLATMITIDQNLTIDGSALATPITISGGNAVRVFRVNAIVTLNGLTITNGKVTSFESGGNILNASMLTVSNSVISNGTSGTSGSGGGIYNYGTLTLQNTVMSGNYSYGGGGAIYNEVGMTVTVINSTISANSATTYGGGIFNDSILTVTSSTLSGNIASGGGGIFNGGSRTLTVTNSTIANNTGNSAAGGMYINSNSPVAITNSTISGNSSPTGSGIINWSVTTVVKNTIIANGVVGPNCHGTGVAFAAGSVNNLADDTSCDTFTNSPSILLGTLGSYGGPTSTIPLLSGSSAINAGDDAACAAAPVNNLDQRGFTRPSGMHCDIGAYEFQIPAPTATTNAASAVTATVATLNGTVNANNDSSTVTFEYGLTTGYGTTVTADQSPVTGATDTAVSKAISGLTSGTTYHYRVVATNGAGTTNGSDQTFSTTVLVLPIVTNFADSGPGSLRDVIANANTGDIITFDPSLSGGTITLATTITINKNLTIDGSALTTPITISGGNAVRVLWVKTGFTLTLQNLTIANGRIAAGLGAGILNNGALTIINSTISGNSATGSGGDGGGVYSTGTLTVTNSTFSGNSANDYNGGGGIVNNFGSLAITNSTFSGNSAANAGGVYNTGTLTVTNSTFSGNSASDPSFGGGGIYSDWGTATISNSTFSGNTAAGFGGGFYNFDGSATITNSTFSGNSAGAGNGGGISRGGGTVTLKNTIVANSTSGGDCSGTVTDGGNNIVEDNTCGFTGGVDPNLSALLANNGGPTQTFALLTTSPAINAGDDVACAAAPVNNLDQRGFTRPSGAHCDIGAYEFQVIAPTATTNAASAVTATGATLNGTVNANTDSSTVTFEYGLDTTYGDIVTADQSPVTGATDTAVSKAISGLTPSTTYHYRVVAVNSAGTTNGADQTFATSPNSTPTDITLSNNSVPEHQSSGTLVGTFTTTDADPGDTFTYSLGCASPGADDSAFYINVNQLFTNATFDYETKNVYSICVRTTDGAAATFDKNFTIHVSFFNEAPTSLNLSSYIIAENNAANAVVGTLSASDPNVSDTLTYSLTCTTPGVDEASFNINGNALRAGAAFDYETKSSYQICIRVTDSGGLTFDQPFTIGIRNLDDSPTGLDPTFGLGGKTTIGFKTFLHGKVTVKFNSNSYGYATAVQADGKIVMAGVSNGDFALARFNSDGSPDTSFGTNGLIVTDFGGNDAAFAAAIQSDGKIVLAGSSYQTGTQRFALARYNSDGSLDATFGSNGKVLTDFGGVDDSGYAIVIQPDGKIIAAGYSYNNATASYDFALARYNSDGSLDNTFGTGGKATADFAGGYDQGYSVALQSNGKIVVAGMSYDATTYANFALARFNADGLLDTSFGAGGKTTTDFAGNEEEGHAVAIQTVGGVDHIVVGGFTFSGGSKFALARYKTSDGTLDTSFGTNGLVTTAFASNASGYSIAVQPDGSIVAAGQTTNPTTFKTDFALARYASNGSPDTSFGASGKLTTDFGDSDDSGKSVALQSDGKIVTAGYSNSGSGTSFALTRYNADGTLDDSFGSVNIPARGRSAAIQSDGKVIIAGYADADTAHGESNFALARLNTDGSLDTTFGAGGTVITDFAMTTQLSSNNDAAYAVAIQADGKIVAGGMVWAGWTNREDFGLVRYNSDGSLDTTFGVNGKVTTNLGNGSDYIQAIAIQTDGKIVAAGWSDNSSNQNFVVARYNSDGSLDTTFGSGGIASADFGGADRIKKIALQSDGKIVAVGSTMDTVTYHSNFAVARFNTDGLLDTTFNTTGKLTADFSGGSDDAYSVAIQSDNKILVAGSTMIVTPPFHSDFALARYNSDGTLDTTFGTGGQLTTDIGENDTAYALLLQPSGHIVAAGTTGAYSYSLWNFAAARYNSSGVLDTSFGTNGKVATNFGGKDDEGRAIVLQADTKFVVAGYSDGLFAAARFLGENAAPTDLALSQNSVAENQPAGTTVGTFTSTDPDASNTFTYSLVIGAGSADNAAFTISGDALKTAYPFNATLKNSYSVRVRTTDQGGLYFEKTLTITVTDLPAIFSDVPDTYWAVTWIERLYNAGITAGCGNSPLIYCPDMGVTRAQMAVFLLRGEHGSTYAPPAVGTGTGFTDVPDAHWAAAWIKQLAVEGITSGCGPSLFCPEALVTRDQMAVFLLRAKYGSSYTPPPATGVFSDVPTTYWAAAWIEQLAAEGITSGCGANTYCPATPVTRAQMAVFLVRTFNLP